MNVLETLMLNSAATLLNCLQYSYLKPEDSSNYLTAEVLASALCDALSQLEKEFPGITEEFGWRQNITQTESDYKCKAIVASDRLVSKNT